MNFLGHGWLAARARADPRFVLGAMLPDLAAMASLRMAAATAADVAAGVRFHHACDARFHAAPWFLAALARARRRLAGDGVPPGCARAAAHVGIELLVDGALVEAGEGLAPYRAALAEMAGVSPDLRWRDPADAAGRFLELGRRLPGAPVPEGYRDPAFVAARLVTLLARRPRLAPPAGAAATIARWLEEEWPRVAAEGPAVVGALTVAVPSQPDEPTESTDPPGSSEPPVPVRFRAGGGSVTEW